MMSESLPGIYVIIVRRVGEHDLFYIGQAKHLAARRRSHQCDLRKNRHFNKRLQNIYNKYGLECLIFTTVLLCEAHPEVLTDHEQRILDSFDRSVVLNHRLDCVTTQLGAKRTEEFKANMSKLKKGKRVLPSEHYAALAQRKRGVPRSLEVRKKISESQKGKICGPESIAKSSATRTGRKRPPHEIEAVRSGLFKRWAAYRNEQERARIRRLLWITSPIVR